MCGAAHALDERRQRRGITHQLVRALGDRDRTSDRIAGEGRDRRSSGQTVGGEPRQYGSTKCADGGDAALFELTNAGELAQVLDLAEAQFG